MQFPCQNEKNPNKKKNTCITQVSLNRLRKWPRSKMMKKIIIKKAVVKNNGKTQEKSGDEKNHPR